MSNFDLDKYINTSRFSKERRFFLEILAPLLANHEAITKVIDIFATKAIR